MIKAQYIDKSSLVAEVKNIKAIEFNEGTPLDNYACIALDMVIDAIDSMKVKDFWKPADGDDLPEIDREVIALLSNGKVVYAHRPNPDGWNGKNILTGDVRHYDVQAYDKGGWNQPNIKWWLDLDLPK